MAELEQKLFKTIPFKVKETKQDRVLEFVGSTELPDRDNEVIKANAWQVDRYTKNPVVQWAHDYTSPPIGKTLSIKQNQKKETIFQIEFADKDTYDFADTIYRLCKGGFLSATSVGFIPIEYDKGTKETDPSRTYTKVELLEISIVPVPANPDALISARNAGVISIKEFDNISKTKDLISDIVNAPVVDLTKHEPNVISQEQIKDEFDYVMAILKEATLNDDNKLLANIVSKEIGRVTGSDKPEVIDKTAIRTLCNKVIKCNKEHHEAHNLCFDTMSKCLDELKSLENGDQGNQPSTPLGDAPSNISREYLQEEIKRQLMEVN